MKRTIFQEETMIKKILYLILMILPVSFILLVNAESLLGTDYPTNIPLSPGNVGRSVNTHGESALRPVLTVIPREIDLGTLKPEETVHGEFRLKNLAPGYLSWSLLCPEGWEPASTKELHGAASGEAESLRVHLSVAESIDNIAGDKTKNIVYRPVMKLSAGGKELSCRRLLKPGQHRTAIRMSSAGGQRNFFVNYRISTLQGLPAVHLSPQRLDFGVQMLGKVISKRIELTNKGRDMLKWSIIPGAMSKKETLSELSGDLPREKYFSFHSEEVPEPGKYVIPENLKDSMELIGKWTEKNGYPMSKGPTASIKFRFHGNGISLFLQSHFKEGHCSVYLDEELLSLPDVLSGEWEKKELMVADGLADGPHVVTIVMREGSLELEGAKVFGKEVMRGPRGWIAVFPNSGTTMTETEYLNVKVDTTNLAPGYYVDQIIFKTNAGEEKAEVFVDVVQDSGHQILDVYLYSRDYDYLLTTHPQAESQRLIQNGYLKEGIAFRLFSQDTPGTKSFYRWYHPGKRDHFYSHDRSGGGKRMDGYVFEGSLGNIATSRLTNTRELYRWFNPSTGRHYYSTSLINTKKGYRYDGIAGYVR